MNTENMKTKRFYFESIDGEICVIDRNKNLVVCKCTTVAEAKAHIIGLNR